MLQPQKRQDMRKALEACMGRMLEIRHWLVREAAVQPGTTATALQQQYVQRGHPCGVYSHCRYRHCALLSSAKAATGSSSLASKGGQSINIRAGLLNKHGPPSAADVWNCRPCSVVKKPVQYIRMQQQAAAGIEHEPSTTL
jgi:hypothetical protein